MLDPHFKDIIEPVMKQVQLIILSREEERVKSKAFPFQVYSNPKLHNLFQIIYQLCKVRGYKAIIKFFPHEAADLEPTLHLLQSQDKCNHKLWETRYVLLLWLSMLCLIPFDLATVDSSIETKESEGTLIHSIISVCKSYLNDPGPTKEASSVCLARLLTRPDMQQQHIRAFLDWAAMVLNDDASDQFLLTGVLHTLSEISQFAHRQHYIQLIPIYFQHVLNLHKNGDQRNTLQRKLIVKLVQRVGLTLLPPKIMPWRYNRGKRSLLLGAEDTTAAVETPEEQQDDDQVDIPDEMEQVVDVLLTGLRDKDTVVRWSSAKGIGRTTGRLPYEFADDIVQCVLELFVDTETDAAWHGGALAVAELARRGLLLPARLEKVVDVVLKALEYDVRRGSTSVGAHVRDAACYMCWAFARAYAPEVMRPYVLRLSQGMLVTTVFDREINCRRAASAAFQENVGRQGHENFPNGIDILTIADYFTVGNRNSAYLDIGKQIAAYPLYRYHLINHCYSVKLQHWDEEIRVTASKALARITPLDPSYMMDTVLPILIEQALFPELFVRHGSTLGAAEILLALSEIPSQLCGELKRSIRNLVPKIEKKRLYRGRGGEIMRAAVCRFIECVALARIQLVMRTQLRFLDTLDECLRHPNEVIRNRAVCAYRAFAHRYFPNAKDKDVLRKRAVDNYIAHVRDSKNVAFRRGYALALGATPNCLLTRDKLTECIDVLATAVELEENPEDRDAEARKAAISGLIELCEHVDGLTPSLISIVFNAILTAMEDYDTDDRGDVGSWVRREAILAGERLIMLLSKMETTGCIDSGIVGKRVEVPKYGAGKIVDEQGDKKVVHVKFDPNTLGSVYFQPLGIALLKTESVEIQKSDVDGVFTFPSLDQRKKYMTSSPTTTPSGADRFLTAETMKRFMCQLMKQLSEKLDVVRETAGATLHRLLWVKDPVLPWIPDRPHMQVIFREDLQLNWASAADTFPLVIKVLEINDYTASIAAGLVLSVGGLTESVVRSSRKALLGWFERHLKLQNFGLLARFSYELLELFTKFPLNDRVIIPLLKTFAVLLESSLLAFLHKDGPKFGMELYEAVCLEIKKCHDLSKLSASVMVLIGLLPSDPKVVERSFGGLLVLLGHKFPRVRKLVAEQLYTRLLIHEDLVEETVLDDILQILTETNWDAPLTQIRSAREPLYQFFKVVRKPSVRPITKSLESSIEKKQDGNYEALVNEMGY